MDIVSILDEELLDFRNFCRYHLKIKDKAGNIVPFVWNNVQTLFYRDAIEPALLSGRPVRARVLKARQMGLSTIIEAFGFWWTYTTAGQSGAVMAHLQESAQHLHNMYRTYYDNLEPELKLQIEKSNRKEILFKSLASAMRILSAEAREGAGRSTTLQFLHTSETAFYPDADVTLTALLQALADNGHWLDESTANGVGGRFYNEWIASVNGTNDMIPCFYAWHQHEEYSTPFLSETEREHFKSSITGEEFHIAKTYNLTLEQLNWRRKTIATKCGNDERIFMQEYPSNDKEAFLTTGRPVFDALYCRQQYERTLQLKPLRISFTLDETTQTVTAKLDSAGNWYMYRPVRPEENEHYRYAVGCDVAEGLEQGDYSSMDVYDRIKDDYPLKFHGHIDPDELAEEQLKLHLWLKGSAFFCTERNNHGLVTVLSAFKSRIPQFYTMDFSRGMDNYTPDQLGFRTTTTSRPILLGTLIEAMREQSVNDDDNGYWDEASTFVRNEKGKMQAQNKDKDPATKCYDDRVFSKALALHCHHWMPPYTKIKEDEARKMEREYWEWAKKNRMRIARRQDKAMY